MYVSHLECPKCNAIFDAEARNQVCTCGSPLLVRYSLDKVAGVLTPAAVEGRPPTLWRYKELLPVRDSENIVTLGEGMTPILALGKIGAEVGMIHLSLKNEGLLPTGTFKDRGAAVGVSRAKELGIDVLAMPTNGNAGGAWATYCARADMEAVIVMPTDAPVINQKEITAAGARLFLVKGLISDAGRIVARAVSDYGWFDASTLKEPYRIEGKKTMGLELIEQLGWKVPDVILYPTGGGVGIIGIYKAVRELQEMGWIGERMPRLVAVQSTGCAPIVRAWEAGREESEYWPDAATVAFGITVPKALGDFLVLEAVRATGGCAVAVTDAEILEAQKRLAAVEGLFVCPEGAATLAAAVRLAKAGWIQPEEHVVLLNTGTGLKYPETVDSRPPCLTPEDSLPSLTGV